MQGGAGGSVFQGGLEQEWLDGALSAERVILRVQEAAMEPQR